MGLKETFSPLVQQALTEFQAGATAVIWGAGIGNFRSHGRISEYYIQLYSLFKLLDTYRVLYVEDTGTSRPLYRIIHYGTK